MDFVWPYCWCGRLKAMRQVAGYPHFACPAGHHDPVPTPPTTQHGEG